MDNILLSLSGNNIGNGTVTLNNQTPPACPTGLGIDAQNYLVNTLGWTVETDYFCEPFLEFVVDANLNTNFALDVYDLNFTNVFDMTVDWGDGYVDSGSYQGNIGYNLNYNYLTLGIYTIKIGFKNKLSPNYLYYYNNNLIDINNIDILPNLINVYFANNRLSASTINDVLIALSGNGLSFGILDLSAQTPPACPTGLGIDAYNHLANDLGWSVNVYICPPTFRSIWRTTSSNETIYLPLESTGTYSFNIDWGDGFTDTIFSYTSNSHTYTNAGNYTVAITGTIEGWNFYNVPGSELNLMEILEWGPLKLGNNTTYFYNCDNLVLTGVTDVLNLVGTTNLSAMFTDCNSLTSVNNINLWDVSGVLNMGGMFEYTPFNEDISNWNVSGVTNMNYMFNGTPFNQNIGNWDVGNVQGMGGMFRDAASFNQDIGSWNVSNVQNMNEMFYGTSYFNNNGSPTISAWTTSAVTSMNSMFQQSAFNQPIGNWDVSNVQYMSYMFHLTNFQQDIGDWDVSNVQDMGAMFFDCTFNNNGSPSISAWTPYSVFSMAAMFKNSPFNQDIGNWNVSSVQDMTQMFMESTFNNNGSPSISAWTPYLVFSMGAMFSDNYYFNQPIGNWNVSGVTEMNAMFNNATSFNQDLSSWCVIQIPSLPGAFDIGASSWTGGTATRPQWGQPC